MTLDFATARPEARGRHRARDDSSPRRERSSTSGSTLDRFDRGRLVPGGQRHRAACVRSAGRAVCPGRGVGGVDGAKRGVCGCARRGGRVDHSGARREWRDGATGGARRVHAADAGPAGIGARPLCRLEGDRRHRGPVGRGAASGVRALPRRADRATASHQRDWPRRTARALRRCMSPRRAAVMSERVEVAIVGSGFAGSLLARVLAVLGYDVVLLERGTHPRFAIGESTTPLANLSLERIARRYGLPDCYRLAAHGRWLEHHPESSARAEARLHVLSASSRRELVRRRSLSPSGCSSRRVPTMRWPTRTGCARTSIITSSARRSPRAWTTAIARS